jgi:hypothetical protein
MNTTMQTTCCRRGRAATHHCISDDGRISDDLLQARQSGDTCGGHVVSDGRRASHAGISAL